MKYESPLRTPLKIYIKAGSKQTHAASTPMVGAPAMNQRTLPVQTPDTTTKRQVHPIVSLAVSVNYHCGEKITISCRRCLSTIGRMVSENELSNFCKRVVMLQAISQSHSFICHGHFLTVWEQVYRNGQIFGCCKPVRENSIRLRGCWRMAPC
jgi:hypothetical protein